MKSARAILTFCPIVLSLGIAASGKIPHLSLQHRPRWTRGAASNPLKIAQLKWYIANSQTHFPVGNQPYGMCFDGEDIWVANHADNTVSKIRASDGSTQGMFSVPGSPVGLAFDGAIVWVSNGPSQPTKMRGSDGRVLGTFNVGNGVFWLTGRTSGPRMGLMEQ